jgi:ATP-dependent Lon protease
LSGASDNSFLRGHNITYEGSTWGKIVDVLMNTEVMNPVFFFDETDKVLETPNGDAIINSLIALIDPSQNDRFEDHYFDFGIKLDVKKAKFIFSFNDEQKVSPILRDRMAIVRVEGSTTPQKVHAIKLRDLKNCRAKVRLDESKVVIPDETLVYIIEHYTNGEKGMRNFVRAVETIFNKINLKRFEATPGLLFKESVHFEIPTEGPLIVTPQIVTQLLQKDEAHTGHLNMYL